MCGRYRTHRRESALLPDFPHGYRQQIPVPVRVAAQPGPGVVEVVVRHQHLSSGPGSPPRRRPSGARQRCPGCTASSPLRSRRSSSARSRSSWSFQGRYASNSSSSVTCLILSLADALPIVPRHPSERASHCCRADSRTPMRQQCELGRRRRRKCRMILGSYLQFLVANRVRLCYFIENAI